MKSSIRVEQRDRTDRVYPGARFVPCVPRLPGVYDEVEPIYAVATWPRTGGEWVIEPADVGMSHGAAMRRFSLATQAVDRDHAQCCALVCVTGVRVRDGKYDAAGVVLDVSMPAGPRSNHIPMIWPCGLRVLFGRVSSYLPAPAGLFRVGFQE